VATGQLDVTVVLPCFNEEGHVLAEIERITTALDHSDLSYELLVIDDKSTDGTLAVVSAAAARFPRVRVLALPRNAGSGTARRLGTQLANGAVVVWTDADLTYPNERIPDFVELLREHPEYDQVVGARDAERGSHKLLRVPAKWLIRRLAEVLSGATIPDLNSGMRAFRRDVSLPYLRLLPSGFSCVTTLTLAFLANQHEVAYVPITYGVRAGRSKFRILRDAYRYLLQVLRMVMYFDPIKVLMPVGLVLLGTGAAKTLVDVVRYHLRVTTNATLLVISGLIVASLALLADLVVRSRDD
jgi:polyisoprenyl-phosphate glycosyltransferase